MKPRTPGRLVDFTSSVLSPLAQAQWRAERRLSVGSASSLASQGKLGSSVVDEADKENWVGSPDENAEFEAEAEFDADVSMSDALEEPAKHSPSPLRKSIVVKAATAAPASKAITAAAPIFKPVATAAPASKAVTTAVLEPLSQTAWTRDHWLFLEQLIVLRRRGPFPFAVEREGFVSESGLLLGRTVEARGEAMTLQQWHLDVVDVFQAEVGGWSAEVLAKRAFSLLMCDTVRREGRMEELKSRRTRRGVLTGGLR